MSGDVKLSRHISPRETFAATGGNIADLKQDDEHATDAVVRTIHASKPPEFAMYQAIRVSSYIMPTTIH